MKTDWDKIIDDILLNDLSVAQAAEKYGVARQSIHRAMKKRTERVEAQKQMVARGIVAENEILRAITEGDNLDSAKFATVLIINYFQYKYALDEVIKKIQQADDVDEKLIKALNTQMKHLLKMLEMIQRSELFNIAVQSANTCNTDNIPPGCPLLPLIAPAMAQEDEND